MLYQRYGNPLELLQQMLQAGNLTEFIVELGQIMWKEKTDKRRWDYWLHRPTGMTFEEYVKTCEIETAEPETADMDEIETIMKNSTDILENFSM